MMRPTVVLGILANVVWAQDMAFYVPENSRFTVVDSAVASIGFTLEKTLRQDEQGHLVSISSFVDPDGNVMHWHDFGNLEGPGWAANAVGGAHEIFAMGRFLRNKDWMERGLRIVDHVLEGGFIDRESGMIRGYRDTSTGQFCLNYKHNSQWFCPGSMAKIGVQLLRFSDAIEAQGGVSERRVKNMRTAAEQCATWIEKHLETAPNGWFPRRCTPDGKAFRKTPEGGSDHFWQTSADGLFIIQLQCELTTRKLADYSEAVRQKTGVFVDAGGIFGSINHDTYDAHENVAYSVAFRTLLAASRVLDDPGLRQFAYDKCLSELDRFRLREDRNGVATRGLLFMERTWNTAYLWENAEAAVAYFEAAEDLLHEDPGRSRSLLIDGLTILRAAARHHYGDHGFLTEGVDWDNIVGKQHHIGDATYGAIRYTEPFLNNQHIAEPTLFYLRRFAEHSATDDIEQWRDLEGNVIYWRARRE